jgi:hypothetical protein
MFTGSRAISDIIPRRPRFTKIMYAILAMRNTAVRGGKPIAVWSQSISGVSANINPLVAFYDIHGRKGEVIFFYFVPDTTRDENLWNDMNILVEAVSAIC